MSQAVRHKAVARSAAPAVMRSPAPAPVTTPRVAPRVQCQSMPRVSSPKDPEEKEAERTARKIMRMAAPEAAVTSRFVSPYAARFADAARLMRGGRQIARRSEGQPDTGSNVAAELSSGLASGSPLPLGVRRFMEPRFQADFSAVRIHTDDRSAKLNRQFSAQAFTYGNQIFFGKDRFQPETHEGKELIAHELTHTVQQGAAVQRREDVTVSQQAPVHVQRLGIGDALDFFADKANLIPGFRMFTIILGVNPINMSRVERSAANIMRAVVEFIPGGGLITRALDRYGVFDRVGTWVEEQIRSLGMTGSVIRTAIDRFVDSLSWRDIFDLGGVWERAKRIFTEPIDRIITFARNLIAGILRFIRDAVLRPLAALAQNTRGYDMLKVVLGQDPITGEPYPRTPENVIGGFMRLIGQEEKWRHLQESRAIPRAWAWFQAQMATLMGFVRQVPGLFVQAIQSLQISDLLDLPGVFTRMRGIFGGFLSSFFSWAADAALQIMMFIFEALAPGAMPVLRRAMSVIRTIIAEPIRFVGNLVRAGLQGFRQFGTNIRTHLVSGLVGWLTGALTGAGLQLPAQWDLRGILSLVLQILGLTWQNIRQKLVRVMGETAVAALETTFDILVTLVRQGPAAAWQKIVEQLQNLQEMVFGQIRDWVVQTVVTQAVMRIVSMLNPAGAVIQAIIAIYNTIMFFRERLQQIIQVAESFFNSIAAIASGSIGAAADRVEQTMARLVPVVISFLARLIGLGGISDTIRRIIDRVRQPIDRALDRLVDWLATQARRLFARLFGPRGAAPGTGDFRERAKAELAARFKGELSAGQVRSMLQAVYAKYRPEGLKGVVARPIGGRGTEYEATLIASTVKVSTAGVTCEIEAGDLDLGWGGTTATVVFNGEGYDPYRAGDDKHAEEKLIADWNKKMPQLAKRDAPNLMIISITRSPCGVPSPPQHDCAGKLAAFIAHWRGRFPTLTVTVRAASIYFGKFRKSSKQAIHDLAATKGVTFTHWDLVEEMGDKTQADPKDVAKLEARIKQCKDALPAIIKEGAEAAV